MNSYSCRTSGPVVVKLMNEAAAYGKIWNFAGAGTTTQRDLVAEMERQIGPQHQASRRR